MTTKSNAVFKARPGMFECPGSFAGNHIKLSMGTGTCRYCHDTMPTRSYGSVLKSHYVYSFDQIPGQPPINWPLS